MSSQIQEVCLDFVGKRLYKMHYSEGDAVIAPATNKPLHSSDMSVPVLPHWIHSHNCVSDEHVETIPALQKKPVHRSHKNVDPAWVDPATR